MTFFTRLAAPLLLGLALAPGQLYAAGATSHPHGVTAPKPVAVYEGRQLIASGLTLPKAIAKARTLVSFTIKSPRYTPTGYVAQQLAVTPKQRDVSDGFTTLSYLQPVKGAGATPSTNGFQIDQASKPIPYVGATHVTKLTVNHMAATLYEFKTAGQKADILILTWVDSAGNGYDIATDAHSSHLSSSVLVRIAVSLR